MFILGVYSDQAPDNFDAVIDIANVRELYGISVCMTLMDSKLKCKVVILMIKVLVFRTTVFPGLK